MTTASTITNRRNVLELSEFRKDITEVPDLIKSLNETIVDLNFILRSLTLVNLDGEIREVVIPAESAIKIGHKLKITPRYTLILNQVGGGLIRNISSTRAWVHLENTGNTDASITVFIVKD